MKSSRRSDVTRRVLRVVHRDLGFLMVGVCLVYALSGIFLNHMNGKDPAYRLLETRLQLDPGLSREELAVRWDDHGGLPVLKRVLPVDEGRERLLLDGGTGIYDRATGRIDYEKYERNHFIYWINKLHYNRVKGWAIMADFFAASLIFFAVSGLWIVKGRKGLAGRGKWLLLAGTCIPIIYILWA
ncbi:MAG: PepSY-associated TM helix domain-containing protein [Odoribacteraceae bacterium]|jgi:hypothetical protein|nr:PepSY-associated TM helix domain-containing protein [Odoribacteraceae bacterium]